MGIINHNVVIATVSSRDLFEKMRQWIDALNLEKSINGCDPKKLFIFGDGIVNDYHTIALIPDGSKEGWPDSALGDDLRRLFIDKLNAEAYGDGSSSWAWVEIGYGEFGQKILQGNNQNRYTGQKEEECSQES